jgi:hypothetical protein
VRATRLGRRNRRRAGFRIFFDTPRGVPGGGYGWVIGQDVRRKPRRNKPMSNFKAVSAVLLTLSVAACGSSSEMSDGGGPEAPPEVSRIFDVTLPEGEELASLTDSARATIEAFDTRNQLEVATSLPTSGNAVYLGSTAMGFGDGTDARLVEGDVVLFADFETPAIGGQFQDLSVNDLNGTETPVFDVIRIDAAPIVDGRYSTTVSRDPFSIGGETASIDATLDGAFVEDGSGTIGVIGGGITVGSDPSQSLSGVFSADRQ